MARLLCGWLAEYLLKDVGACIGLSTVTAALSGANGSTAPGARAPGATGGCQTAPCVWLLTSPSAPCNSGFAGPRHPNCKRCLPCLPRLQVGHPFNFYDHFCHLLTLSRGVNGSSARSSTPTLVELRVTWRRAAAREVAADLASNGVVPPEDDTMLQQYGSSSGTGGAEGELRLYEASAARTLLRLRRPMGLSDLLQEVPPRSAALDAMGGSLVQLLDGHTRVPYVFLLLKARTGQVRHSAIAQGPGCVSRDAARAVNTCLSIPSIPRQGSSIVRVVPLRPASTLGMGRGWRVEARGTLRV